MKKELVKMTKDGEEPIEVSPLVVENHRQLGWKVVGEKPEVEAESTPESKEDGKKNRTRRRVGVSSKPATPESKEDSEA